MLGELPGEPQPSQKMFESLRAGTRSQALDPRAPVFVEAESKKIGQLQVPDALLERMRAAECVRLEVPVDARDVPDRRNTGISSPIRARSRSSSTASSRCTAARGSRAGRRWPRAAPGGSWSRDLLDEHYDPAYRRSSHRNFVRLAEARVRARAHRVRDEAVARLAAQAVRELPELQPA